MQETARIILPLPPAILSPNSPPGSRGGRFARAAASKKYKRLAMEATLELGIEHPWQGCTCKATFYHKTHRRRDDINSMAQLKALFDGVVLGGLVFDDDSEHWKTETPEFFIDTKNPRVELLFTRVR